VDQRSPNPPRAGRPRHRRYGSYRAQVAKLPSAWRWGLIGALALGGVAVMVIGDSAGVRLIGIALLVGSAVLILATLRVGAEVGLPAGHPSAAATNADTPSAEPG
jgi:hypothetical protein